MTSDFRAKVPLNISSILKNFKSFIKKYIKKNAGKILARKRIKIITSEQKEAKKQQLLRLKVTKKIDF